MKIKIQVSSFNGVVDTTGKAIGNSILIENIPVNVSKKHLKKLEAELKQTVESYLDTYVMNIE